MNEIACNNLIHQHPTTFKDKILNSISYKIKIIEKYIYYNFYIGNFNNINI